MKNEKRIRAVEMTRQIRDRMYEETRNMSDEELLRYLRERSRGVRERIENKPSQREGSQRAS